MKNRKLAALMLGMAFIFSISVGGCAEKEPGEESPGGNMEQESPEQESMEQGAESREKEVQAMGPQTESVQQESEHEFGNLREFEALALDGSTFTQEDFAHKDITVINFWALSCGPCLAEMPDLAAFGKELPDNIRLMTVCLDGSGNEEYVQYVMEQTEFEGTTLLSGNGDLLSFCQELQYTPTTVLVDQAGNAVGYAIIGGRENLAESYTECINTALAELGKDEISIDVETDTE